MNEKFQSAFYMELLAKSLILVNSSVGHELNYVLRTRALTKLNILTKIKIRDISLSVD